MEWVLPEPTVGVEEHVFAALLSGLTPGKEALVASFLQREAPSSKAFTAALDRIGKVVQEVWKEAMDKALADCSYEVEAQRDCCWAVRGQKSPMGTSYPSQATRLSEFSS